jgi:hypothetical protein|nr:MAG TPA: hypothetical protein [Crassvirales sp.]
MWEKWGSGSINVDLSDYITKAEANSYIQEQVNNILSSLVIDGGELII